MRVRFLTVAAGPSGVAMPGDEREVDEAAGRQMVAGGYAVALSVDAPPALASESAPMEVAAMEVVETTSRANPPKKRFGRA